MTSEHSAREELSPSFWRRVHFLWFGTWAFLVTIPCSLMLILTHQVWPTARNFKRWSGLWARLILGGIGIRVHTTDGAHLPADQPCLFVSNHQCALDILVLAAAVPYPFGFLAKAELARVPFLGLAIRNSPSVLIDRSDMRRSLASMKLAGERIRAGTSVLVFAEGSRSYGAEMLPFKKGAFLLAMEAGVPLVPVAIVDAYRHMDERRKLLRGGTVHLRLGAPIPLDTRNRRDVPHIMEEMRMRIEALLQDSPAQDAAPLR